MIKRDKLDIGGGGDIRESALFVVPHVTVTLRFPMINTINQFTLIMKCHYSSLSTDHWWAE